MNGIEAIYTIAMRAARLATPLFGHGRGKLARGIRGRRGAIERIERWARSSRIPGAPLIWFHAPSVGEGFQARAVIESLRRMRPDVQVAYTFFSPSAEVFASKSPVDVADYLPLDVPEAMDRLLDALAPDAIAFSKTEVWPNLSERASRRGIPTLLLSATLPAGSSRLQGGARRLLTPAHARLSLVAAISSADAERFAALGVSSARRVVMGDARFDQASRRTETAASSELVMHLRTPDRVTLVAGSTWPADELRLIPAFASAIRVAAKSGADPTTADTRRYRMIIAPHEPTELHLAGIERRLSESSLPFIRLRDLGDRGIGDGSLEESVILVDRVGVLGDLYALADIAYVGGGFGRAGLHSVLEPAAFGAPVIFGPRHANAREAAALIDAGGAISAASEAELRAGLQAWMADDEVRSRAGKKAGELVERELGAADRGAEMILGLLRR